jgi:hypothetical protein
MVERAGDGAMNEKMSEGALFGLWATAKEHQAAVEKAAKTLDQAREAFDKERAGIPAAVAEAAKALLIDQGKEMQRVAAEARQTLANAARSTAGELAAAMRITSLWGLLAVFALGLGLGGAGVWVLLSKRLDRIEAATYETWKQTPEGVKATAEQAKAGN